jgi:mitochondrial distribution and morphology protein 34
MAFNFNWSPLATDASFYERAKELLTNALNRAGPRPAIIVDDFLVSEFNLGDVPPELEIVEIGDLAEDKFRGTFKMRYQGDAVLSLKTKVQANPLNTYLLTRSSFATPQPLAASTGLTIPLQITLSEIRLSGFIILVFSRQKGLTIVFKDDPLESLRVSSTFDSIPFVANYLQKEIEGQLRNLLMDELPAIIHRLSLRLWAPEHKAHEEREVKSLDDPSSESIVDPLATPPQDPVDASGNVLTPAEVASLSLDSSIETQSLFSQKNLIRLATLTDSHRTLSLFTPSIRDAVFRAWTGPLERGEMLAFSRVVTPALSRVHSHTGSISSIPHSIDSTLQGRPSLYSFPSTGQSITLGAGRHGKAHRKRKKRVVNLRKQPESAEADVVVEDGSTVTDSASVTESTSEAPSIFSAPPAATSSGMGKERELMSPMTSPVSPRKSGSLGDASSLTGRGAEVGSGPRNRLQSIPLDSAEHDPFVSNDSAARGTTDSTIRMKRRQNAPLAIDIDTTPRASMYLGQARSSSYRDETSRPSALQRSFTGDGKASNGPSPAPLPNFMQFLNESASTGSIAEQAWIAKMANEMSRRYEDERAKGSFTPYQPPEDESNPPPAYAR